MSTNSLFDDALFELGTNRNHQNNTSPQRISNNNTNNNNAVNNCSDENNNNNNNLMMMLDNTGGNSLPREKPQQTSNTNNNNTINAKTEDEAYFEDLKKQIRKTERNQRISILADEESAFGGILVFIAKDFFSLPSSNVDALCSIPDSVNQKLAPFQRTGVKFMFQHLIASRLLAASPGQNTDENNNRNNKDNNTNNNKKNDLKSSGGCVLADEMGLGKSVQVASFLGAWAKARISNSLPPVPSASSSSTFENLFRSCLMTNNNNNNSNSIFRTLIVCPSTLVSIWVDALQQWAGVPSNCIEVVTKPKSQRIQQWKQTAKYLNKKSKSNAGGGGTTNRNRNNNNNSKATGRSVSPTPFHQRSVSGVLAEDGIDVNVVGQGNEIMNNNNNNNAATGRSVSPVPMPNNNHNNNHNNGTTANDEQAEHERNLPLYTEVLPQNTCLFFVCTYGVMKNDVSDILCDIPDFDCCVFDEAQMIKDPSTDVAKASTLLKANFRIAVTGTPLSNHFGDIWSVMQFVDSTVIPLSRAEFSQVNSVLMKGNERNISAAEEERAREALVDLRSRLEKFILRREKKQVAHECLAIGLAANNNNNEQQQERNSNFADDDNENENDDDDNSNRQHIRNKEDSSSDMMMMMMMNGSSNKKQRQQQQLQQQFPEKVDAVIWCRLSPEQELLYRRFLECDSVTEALRPGSTKSPLVLLSCLIKICDHPWLNFTAEKFKEALKNPFTAVEGQAESGGALSSSKVQTLLALAKMAKQDNEKLLVFSKSKKFHDIMARVFARSEIDYCRLDGSTPAADRAGLVRKINAFPGSLVCLATTQVGGVGLTFNGISRVVISDPNWNPAVDAQAVDRVHRVGQMSKKVTVIRLVTCGTVEEKVYRNQLHKMIAAFQALGTDPQQLLRYFSHTQLRDMFTLSRTDRSETNHALRAVHVMLYQSGLVSSSAGARNDSHHLPDYPGKDVREVFDNLKKFTNSIVDVSDHGSVLKVSSEARQNLEDMLTTSSGDNNSSNDKMNKDDQQQNKNSSNTNDDDDNSSSSSASKIMSPDSVIARKKQFGAPQRRQRSAKDEKSTHNNIRSKENSAQNNSGSQKQADMNNNNNNEEDNSVDIMDQILEASCSQEEKKKKKQAATTTARERQVTITSPQNNIMNIKNDENRDEEDDSNLFSAPVAARNSFHHQKRLSAQLENQRKSDHDFRHSLADTMWKLCSSSSQNNNNNTADHGYEHNNSNCLSNQHPPSQSTKLSPLLGSTTNATTHQANTNNNDNSENNSHHADLSIIIQQQQQQSAPSSQPLNQPSLPPALSQPVPISSSTLNYGGNNNSNSNDSATNSEDDSNMMMLMRKSSVNFHDFHLDDDDEDKDEKQYCKEDEAEPRNNRAVFKRVATRFSENTGEAQEDENTQFLNQDGDENEDSQNQFNNDEENNSNIDDEEDQRESELLEFFMLDSQNDSMSQRFTASNINSSRASLISSSSRGSRPPNNNLRFNFRNSAIRGTLEARDSDFLLFNEDEEQQQQQQQSDDENNNDGEDVPPNTE